MKKYQQTILLLCLLNLPGCETSMKSAKDDRSIEHDCTIRLSDGTELHCSTEMSKDEGTEEAGQSLDPSKIPAK